MNANLTGSQGYFDARETERLNGHYLLLLAFLGEEEDAHLELARMRVRQRRREQAMAEFVQAEVAV
jgi:hypothetical protein